MIHLKSCHGFDLLKFLGEELDKIDKIDLIETFMVYKGYNIEVPCIVDEKGMGLYEINP